MPLKITLKPGEKFVVNGAVMTNDDRRTTLVLQNTATILRERDILLPQNVTTPVQKVYYFAQLMYLEPEKYDAHYKAFLEAGKEVYLTVPADEDGKAIRAQMFEAVGLVGEGRIYAAMKLLKSVESAPEPDNRAKLQELAGGAEKGPAKSAAEA